jgi:hypothetical protein
MSTRRVRTGVVILVLAAATAWAASVPSWLDDGISNWNTEHPDNPIRFVDIKDSFVWYDMAKTPEMGHQQIRERINAIVLGHGYEPLDDEELVTTGKPPATTGATGPKKCWSRSFVLDIAAQADVRAAGDSDAGSRQRMLTRLVCDDSKTWWAAFRVAG